MTFRRVNKPSSNESQNGTSEDSDREIFPSRPLAFASNPTDVYETLAYSGGTLPRSFQNNGRLQKWRPLTQSSELIRTNIVLEKNADEAFGFEIQTFGLHHQNENLVEMCTFVCKVHDHSPAKLAGLKVGYTIVSVNETSVEGCQHKEIVQLVRSSGNTLRLETLYSDSIRRAELDAKLQYLKQTMHEKWDEYRSLMVQEQRLTHGIVMSDAAIYESLESAGVYGSLGLPSPISPRAQHLLQTSNSSSASHLSTVSDEDSVYQSCPYQGKAAIFNSDSFRKVPLQLSAQCLLRPARELFATASSSLTRSASMRSYLRERGDTASSSGNKQGWFGVMLHKPKHRSLPRRLLKFIPGLNHALEEEESKL